MAAKSLKQARREFELALTAILELLIHCGTPQKVIATITRRAIKSAIAKAEVLPDTGGDELATLGLVLDAWHRDRRYLTSRGKPRAIRLLGRIPSVEALIRTQGRHFDAVALARRIQALQLIEPCSGNRFRPTSDTALVSRYSPTALQYVARSLISLLETVEHNLRGGPNAPLLLERIAEVPTLPIDCLEPFREFSGSQGSVFMRTMNDWLETRRIRDPGADGRKAVRAGVHLYVYIAPVEAPPPPPASAKRR